MVFLATAGLGLLFLTPPPPPFFHPVHGSLCCSLSASPILHHVKLNVLPRSVHFAQVNEIHLHQDLCACMLSFLKVCGFYFDIYIYFDIQIILYMRC